MRHQHTDLPVTVNRSLDRQLALGPSNRQSTQLPSSGFEKPDTDHTNNDD